MKIPSISSYGYRASVMRIDHLNIIGQIDFVRFFIYSNYYGGHDLHEIINMRYFGLEIPDRVNICRA